MTAAPSAPKIYHITRVENLAGIAQEDGLFSDSARIKLGVKCELVGLSEIKKRRLEELVVKCHPPTKVGEYVPFYFCPRSIMLYIFYRNDLPELSYRGGQVPIVHLQADLHKTIAWATKAQRRWAFTNANAGAYLTDFFCRLSELDNVNWEAVTATQWGAPQIKEAKQAEFLVEDFFDWTLVERIGVHDSTISAQAAAALKGAKHVPTISVEPNWYY
jgi:hypothetical protein